MAQGWMAAAMLAAAAAGTPGAPPPEHPDGDGGVSAFYRSAGPIGRAGRMLAQEALPEPASQPAASRSQRILYSSTSGVGRGAVAVSGAMYLPKGAMPAGGWPIVAWAHGTTGFADVCAPSWAGRSPRDRAYLDRWLVAGFAVVATDYEGLGTPGVHPYLLWRSEGQAVLDALRAARATYPKQLANRILVVGQSQGSGAAIGATILAPTYAPELGLVGTIATGLVMTIEGSGEGSGSGDYLGKAAAYTDPAKMDPAFAMLRIAGTDRALHPDTDAADFVTPKGRRMLAAARTSCLRDMMAFAKREAVAGGDSFARDLAPIDRDMEAAFRIPAVKLSVPVFAGTGLADSMASVPGQYDAVKALCAAGNRIQWRTYKGLTHGGAVNGSLVDSMPFARAILAGRPVPNDCARLEKPGMLETPAAGVPFNE